MARQIVSAAPGGDGWSLRAHPEYAGKLHIIEPLSIERGVKTQYDKPGQEPGDATRANVYVLLSATEHAEHLDTLIFPKVVQSQLRREVGSGNVVVGRLFSDTDSQQKGQSAPWKLAEATPKDIEKATAFLTAQSVKGATSNDGGGTPDGDDEEEAF